MKTELTILRYILSKSKDTKKIIIIIILPI